MRTGGFRFARGPVAWPSRPRRCAVAVTYHLPLRDPDGVAVPTYVRLPMILLLAFLTDVVPRAAVARPLAWSGSPRTLVAVIRERWPWEHVRFALVGLGAWYLTYAAFRNLKSFVPFVNRKLWDRTLSTLDRILLLGHDPATVLHQPVRGRRGRRSSSPSSTSPGSCSCRSRWSSRWSGRATGPAASWYVTAVAVDWVLGVATYFAVPTLGPVYAQPQDFVALPHTYVTTLQDDDDPGPLHGAVRPVRDPRGADDRGVRVAARRDHGHGLPDGRAAAHEALGRGSRCGCSWR